MGTQHHCFERVVLLNTTTKSNAFWFETNKDGSTMALARLMAHNYCRACFLQDGNTYEESAIRDWISRHPTSPMTNLPLSSFQLVPNLNLRSAILEWKELHQKKPLYQVVS